MWRTSYRNMYTLTKKIYWKRNYCIITRCFLQINYFVKMLKKLTRKNQ